MKDAVDRANKTAKRCSEGKKASDPLYYIDGVRSKFGKHGFCARDNWIADVGDGWRDAGTFYGAMHPNKKGAEKMADRMVAYMTPKIEDLLKRQAHFKEATKNAFVARCQPSKAPFSQRHRQRAVT